MGFGEGLDLFLVGGSACNEVMEAVDDELVVGVEVGDVVGTVVARMFCGGIGELYFDLVDVAEIPFEVCPHFVFSGFELPIDEFLFSNSSLEYICWTAAMLMLPAYMLMPHFSQRALPFLIL